MSRKTISLPAVRSLDWKGVGYLISIVSVFLLGAIAWPKTGEPSWKMPVLLLGMLTSIVGMACRFKAHLAEVRKLKHVETEAQRKS